MLFMVIERFKDRDAKAVYRRFREQGRMAPEGLTYVGSWIEANFDRCFQLGGGRVTHAQLPRMPSKISPNDGALCALMTERADSMTSGIGWP